MDQMESIFFFFLFFKWNLILFGRVVERKLIALTLWELEVLALSRLYKLKNVKNLINIHWIEEILLLKAELLYV